MDANIQVDSNSTISHKLFGDWLNGLLANYVSGFWDSLVTNIILNFSVQKTNLILQEMHDATGRNLLGFLIFSNTEGLEKEVFYFNNQGVPTHYCKQGIDSILNIDPQGEVIEFFTENEITLVSPTEPSKTLGIYLHFYFGSKFPMMYFKELSGAIVSRGILDVNYENDERGVYKAVIVPDISNGQYHVILLNLMKTTFEIPIFPDFTVKYTVGVGQSFLVPNTPSTLSYLKEASANGSIKYKLIP